ncbi:MAG TPA: TIGR00730 family Rossman fold protein [Spirochaetota bacterium]
MQSVCVYCGSSFGNDEIYRAAAVRLGHTLADEKIRLIYGGGRVGLMGVIADTVLSAGGSVTGIIPRFLSDQELSHKGLSELIIVETMHERKQAMFEHAAGFIAMPGGFGTFEEIFEMITWGQLGLHRKPCAFYNTNGFYDGIARSVDRAVADGFIGKEFSDTIYFDDDPHRIISRFSSFTPSIPDKAKHALDELTEKG